MTIRELHIHTLRNEAVFTSESCQNYQS